MKDFKKHGVYHKLIKFGKIKNVLPNQNTGDYLNKPRFVCVYALGYDELDWKVVGYNVHILVERVDRFSPDGDRYLAQPSTSDWGKLGWSFYEEGLAINKFYEVREGKSAIEEEVL